MNSSGFTLIEVLVSLAIVSLIGLIAFAGLNTSITFNDKTLAISKATNQLVIADTSIKKDLLHSLNRLYRDERGVMQRHSFFGITPRNEGRVLLFTTHTGLEIPTQDGAIRLVEYFLEDSTLKRAESSYADMVEDTKISETTLLENVTDLKIKFFLGGEWLDEWPVTEWTDNNGLPQLVEITFQIEGIGRIVRNYLLPGGYLSE